MTALGQRSLELLELSLWQTSVCSEAHCMFELPDKGIKGVIEMIRKSIDIGGLRAGLR